MSKFEVMSTAQVRNMPTPEWLVDNIIPQHGTIQLFGPEGSHKSFIALDMAFCIATGKSFHGHAVQQGRVLYIASEGGAPIGKRLRAWEEHNNTTTEDVDFYMKEELMLDDPESVDEALKALNDNDYRFVIIDTLRTSILGDEVSPRTMGEVTRSMRKLQRELDTTVLIVHHSIKSNKGVYAGSNVMGANIATNIRVSYDEKATTTFECLKQKDAEKFDTIAFGHKQVGESLVMVSGDSGQTMSNASPHDETIVKLLKKYPEGIAKSTFRDECISNGVPRSSCYKRYTTLEAQGLLRVDDSGRMYPL